ncbi:alpha/beta hydrolase [Mycobacterium sp. M1]|uniref:Alpha/beta hydrolase n=1 Tax=Mycolicibacter acidiphilus TaxID=2835306 RepID=A0ABS5RH44_9MYCO|nr:alpha/beta hydrolase [Mycolicibacter acidiphilus]MBS9533598.1 alpha/beta hydrolase [Mycolicibacter acidiphilus]
MSLARRARIARTTLVCLAVAMTMLTVGSCTRMTVGHAVLAMPRVGQPVQWDKCRFTADTNIKVPDDARCGFLAVPVDYSNLQGGDVARLALIKFPATKNKIGSLVINPGGPGESGIETAVGLIATLPRSVRERFDLVGFDPRGVASSRPAVWCNSDEENDRLRALNQVDYSPAGVAKIEQETQDYVDRCLAKTGKQFLANVGTVNVARDLDAIRAGLGDDKLTYLGYSYGTRIGSAYAEAFPQNVRAMILDGAVDPNADPVEEDLRQAAAFQGAFDDYAADCAKDSRCPLGTDPAKAVDVYHHLVDPLVDKPAKTRDPRGLSYSDAVVGTIMALYSPTFWTHLTDGLSDLVAGRGDIMLSLADLYMRRDAKGHYTNATDARVAVNCVDQPPIKDRAVVIDEDKRSREVAPFMSYGKFTGDAPLGTCAFWPVPATTEPHAIDVPDLAPTMVVSTTRDPATPYQAGVDLAKQLRGGLLTFNGTQHTVVFQGNECVDGFASRYLIDGTLPPANAKC